MRILHLVHNIHTDGNGIVHAAIDVATFQKRAGHEVAIASGSGNFLPLLQAQGVPWYELSLQNRNGRLLAPFRFRSVLRRFKPEIVHAHGFAGTILARAMRLGSRYRIVSTAHRVYDRELRLLGLADGVIALSESNADALAQGGVARAKLHVIKNGTIGTLRHASREHSAVTLEHPAVVTLAGLYERKGIDVLIRAFAHIADAHPDAHLYLVGEGPERAALETLAASFACVARIHFEGFTTDTTPYLRACDVFVLASHRESFPLALIEAREAGCPIVSTDVDGAREALDGGNAGLLVPPGDAPALAAAIDRFLASDALRAEYRARTAVNIAYFSAERMARETLRAYEAL
jgi:glycosyltransferase involved in cell wall biosynthesis